MSSEPLNTPPLVGTLDYLAEVAKDWARQRFANAQRGDFTLPPHRFELRGDRVRRRRIRPSSPEAHSRLAAPGDTIRPTAWCHAAILTLLTDTGTETIAREQEIVEVLVSDGDEIIAEAAFVARIPGFPPCLGRFRSSW
jgi:hypothetical protein